MGRTITFISGALRKRVNNYMQIQSAGGQIYEKKLSGTYWDSSNSMKIMGNIIRYRVVEYSRGKPAYAGYAI